MWCGENSTTKTYFNLMYFFLNSSFDSLHMLAVKMNNVVESAWKLTEARVTLYPGMLLNVVVSE